MNDVLDKIQRVWSIDALHVLPQVGMWVSEDDDWVAYAMDWFTVSIANVSTGKHWDFKTRGKVQWFQGSARHAFAVGGGSPLLLDLSDGKPVDACWQRPEREVWEINDAVVIEDRRLAILTDLSGPAMRVLDLQTMQEVSSTPVKTELTANLVLVVSQQGFGYVSSPEGEEFEMTPFSLTDAGEVVIATDRTRRGQNALRLVDDDRLLVACLPDTSEYFCETADLKQPIQAIPEILTWNGKQYAIGFTRPVWLANGLCIFAGSILTAPTSYRNPILVNILDGSIVGDVSDHFVPARTVPDYEPFYVPCLSGPRLLRYTGNQIELWRYLP